MPILYYNATAASAVLGWIFTRISDRQAKDIDFLWLLVGGLHTSQILSDSFDGFLCN